MSLYNWLCGKNRLSGVLLQILDIDQGNKWSSGRFRDMYLNKDGTKILLYTRNGGGNREHYDEYADNKEGMDCSCQACCINHQLPKHPNYIKDYDDDFDCTYATVEFSVPEHWVEFFKDIANEETSETGPEKMDKQMELITKGDPEALAKAQEIFAPILYEIKKMSKNKDTEK